MDMALVRGRPDVRCASFCPANETRFIAPFNREGDGMAVPIAVASTVLAVILVIALAREIRLRRALESLLRRLLTYWRSHEERKPRDAGHSVDAGDCRLHK
jgi:hypothetical protein